MIPSRFWSLASRWDPPSWIGDREFTATDLDLVFQTARRSPRLGRWERTLAICENLSREARFPYIAIHVCHYHDRLNICRLPTALAFAAGTGDETQAPSDPGHEAVSGSRRCRSRLPASACFAVLTRASTAAPFSPPASSSPNRASTSARAYRRCPPTDRVHGPSLPSLSHRRSVPTWTLSTRATSTGRRTWGSPSCLLIPILDRFVYCLGQLLQPPIRPTAAPAGAAERGGAARAATLRRAAQHVCSIPNSRGCGRSRKGRAGARVPHAGAPRRAPQAPAERRGGHGVASRARRPQWGARVGATPMTRDAVPMGARS